MTVAELYDLLNKGGLLAVFVLIAIGGATQKWVWGWMYAQEQKEKRYWRDMALFGKDVAQRAMSRLDDEGGAT